MIAYYVWPYSFLGKLNDFLIVLLNNPKSDLDFWLWVCQRQNIFESVSCFYFFMIEEKFQHRFTLNLFLPIPISTKFETFNLTDTNNENWITFRYRYRCFSPLKITYRYRYKFRLFHRFTLIPIPILMHFFFQCTVPSMEKLSISLVHLRTNFVTMTQNRLVISWNEWLYQSLLIKYREEI